MPELIARDRVVKAIGLPKSQRYATIPNVFDWATHAGLYSEAFLAARTARIAQAAGRLYDQCNAADYFERIMCVDMRLWLPDDLLVKVDRATMAYSLEARVPYLDHRFVEFVARLDPQLKQKGDTRKYLLKKLAEKFLPADNVHLIPALWLVRRQWPDAQLHLMVNAHVASLFKVTPWVDRIWAYPSSPKPGLRGNLRWAGDLRRERFDIVINTTGSDRSSLL